jgi:hypothetical protein
VRVPSSVIMIFIKIIIQYLLETSKKVGLQVITEKAKCMVMSRHRNVGQNHNYRLLIQLLKMWNKV